MLLLLILVGVVTGIPLGNYNVTFPCGPLVNNQRCRFPVEFCDTNQGSCSFCNEDICREQDSDPSCRAFCLDLISSPTKAPIATHSSEEKTFWEHTEYFRISMVTCGVLISLLLAICIGLYLRLREATKPKILEMNVQQGGNSPNVNTRYTDGNNIVSNPVS